MVCVSFFVKGFGKLNSVMSQGDLIHSPIAILNTLILGLIILGCIYIIISLIFNLYILYSSLIEEVTRLIVRKSD